MARVEVESWVAEGAEYVVSVVHYGVLRVVVRLTCDN